MCVYGGGTLSFTGKVQAHAGRQSMCTPALPRRPLFRARCRGIFWSPVWLQASAPAAERAVLMCTHDGMAHQHACVKMSGRPCGQAL